MEVEKMDQSINEMEKIVSRMKSLKDAYVLLEENSQNQEKSIKDLKQIEEGINNLLSQLEKTKSEVDKLCKKNDVQLKEVIEKVSNELTEISKQINKFVADMNNNFASFQSNINNHLVSFKEKFTDEFDSINNYIDNTNEKIKELKEIIDVEKSKTKSIIISQIVIGVVLLANLGLTIYGLFL